MKVHAMKSGQSKPEVGRRLVMSVVVAAPLAAAGVPAAAQDSGKATTAQALADYAVLLGAVLHLETFAANYWTLQSKAIIAAAKSGAEVEEPNADPALLTDLRAAGDKLRDEVDAMDVPVKKLLNISKLRALQYRSIGASMAHMRDFTDIIASDIEAGNVSAAAEAHLTQSTTLYETMQKAVQVVASGAEEDIAGLVAKL